MIAISIINDSIPDLTCYDLTAFSPPENFFFDSFNFSDNSISFFLDYLTFKEVSTYIFVGSYKKRTNYVVSFLNSIQNEITFLSIQKPNDYSKIKEFLGLNLDFIKEIILSHKQTKQIRKFNNFERIKDFYSGISTVRSKNYVLRGLYIEEPLINKLDQSILLNCTLNSIYINPNNPQKFRYIFNSSEEFDTPFVKEKYLTINSLHSKISLFLNTGKIDNIDRCHTIRDYNTLAQIHSIQRLCFLNDGVYLDSQKNNLITPNINTSFTEIINNISIMYEKNNSILAYYYPYFFNLSGHIDNGSNFFITPFNSFFLENKLNTYVPIDIIGIVTNRGKYYLYSTINNKLFTTNKAIIFLLELYLKNLLSDPKFNISETAKEKFIHYIQSMN